LHLELLLTRNVTDRPRQDLQALFCKRPMALNAEAKGHRFEKKAIRVDGGPGASSSTDN
jgi:hypothetical protein